jgi:hypothetical protein
LEPLPRAISHRKALLLLRIPIAPTAWPARLELAFPLLSHLSTSLKDRQIAINAVYDPPLPLHSSTSPFTNFDDLKEVEAGVYFPDGKSFQISNLTENGEGMERLKEVLNYGPNSVRSKEVSWATPLEVEGGESVDEILVCTHGSRDCRCSDKGGPLVLALREEIERRGVEGKVRVREVAHVGGHK